MEAENIRQIIREELKNISTNSIVKDVHLHIHGDNLDVFRLLERLVSLDTALLESRVMESLGIKLENES